MPSVDPRIEHVVVLMLENRSFDHMLGFLPHADQSFRGLQAGGFHNMSADGVAIPATNDGDPSDAAPDHSHAGVLEQISGYGDVPANGGFVRSYASASGDPAAGVKVMLCLDSLRRCPVLAQLAKEFAVCDAWFSSVPGETWPNRNFAHAATSDGATNIEVGLYYDPTIFERLARGGATWRIYHDGVAQAWCFRNLWRTKVSWLDQLRGRRATIGNWYLQSDFYVHLRAGDLPSYAFIEPAHVSAPGEVRATNSQHPDNNRQSSADFYAGEELIRSIYGALLDNAALFEKTMLLITYDEHGGLYDHVPPPSATPPGGRVWRSWTRRIGILVRGLLAKFQGRPMPMRDDFAFDRLGVRVPAVLISPWIPPGTVVHTEFEHASIPATLRALFVPQLPYLTARDAAANTFHDVLRDHGLPVPRQHLATLPAASRGADGGIPHLAGLSATMPHVTPPAANNASGPRSQLDQQLVELGQQVHEELRREGAVPTVPPTPPAAARTSAAPIAAAPPASVGDEFADAARAARQDRTRP
jgi:phospholipase C